MIQSVIRPSVHPRLDPREYSWFTVHASSHVSLPRNSVCRIVDKELDGDWGPGGEGLEGLDDPKVTKVQQT